jgi:hypothetical protein
LRPRHDQLEPSSPRRLSHDLFYVDVLRTRSFRRAYSPWNGGRNLVAVSTGLSAHKRPAPVNQGDQQSGVALSRTRRAGPPNILRGWLPRQGGLRAENLVDACLCERFIPVGYIVIVDVITPGSLSPPDAVPPISGTQARPHDAPSFEFRNVPARSK